MRSLHRTIGATFAFALGLAAGNTAATAQQASDSQMMANDHFACASVMEYAVQNGRRLPVDSSIVWQLLDRVLAKGGTSEQAALEYTKAEWQAFGYQRDAEIEAQPAKFYTYVMGMADECADIYGILVEREASKPRELGVTDFDYHMKTTSNPGPIFDYVISRYPGGKSLMGEKIPEGEYLGELVVQIGKQGIMRLSDQVLLAMNNRTYWQYNPPATRIVSAEYQRRLRVRKYDNREAAKWARRAQEDRMAEMQSQAARMAERWGTSIECTNTSPRGLLGKSYTSCGVWDPMKR